MLKLRTEPDCSTAPQQRQGWGCTSSGAQGEHSGTRTQEQVLAPASVSGDRPCKSPVQGGGGSGWGTGRVGTPLGQEQAPTQWHPCSCSGQRAALAHATRSEASAQPQTPQLHAVTAAQAPGEHQGRESLESVGRVQGAPSTHPRLRLMLSWDGCSPAPQPRSCPPPSAPSKPSCCVSTSTAHGLQRWTVPRQQQGGDVPVHRGEGQLGVGTLANSPGHCQRWGEERLARTIVLVACLFSQRLSGEAEHGQRAVTGHGCVQPSSAQGSQHGSTCLGRATLLPGQGLRAAALGLVAGLALLGMSGGGSAGL